MSGLVSPLIADSYCFPKMFSKKRVYRIGYIFVAGMALVRRGLQYFLTSQLHPVGISEYD